MRTEPTRALKVILFFCLIVHVAMHQAAVNVTRNNSACVGFMEPQKHIRTFVIEVGNIAELNKWILN